MQRIGFVFLTWLLISCNDEKKPPADENANKTNSFPSSAVPYQLTEETLHKKSDTAVIRSGAALQLISDSVRKVVSGSSGSVKFTPLADLGTYQGIKYLVVKVVSKNKPAAVLVCIDEANNGAALPFLVPDDDPTTTQVSSVDKSYSISRNITRRKGAEIVGEGRDLFSYDATGKQFTWLVTDPLDESQVVVNPIDTFPRTHRLAGDFVKDKKNIVSVRDSRIANHVLVFIHTEQKGGECRGELKGDFLVTSTTTAQYKQGGDPCSLVLTFSPSGVSLREESGCGNYRGLDCAFDGSYPKKKEPKKQTTKQKRN